MDVRGDVRWFTERSIFSKERGDGERREEADKIYKESGRESESCKEVFQTSSLINLGNDKAGGSQTSPRGLTLLL
jgi:hypothetical protein